MVTYCARQNARIIDLTHFAHDPPKGERFGDKIMRPLNVLERDRMQNRPPLFLIALYANRFPLCRKMP
jgi:hypothetical protein